MSMCPGMREENLTVCDYLKRHFCLFVVFLFVSSEAMDLTIFSSNPVLSSRTGVGIEMCLKQLCGDLGINQATFRATVTYSLLPRTHYTHI